MRFFWNFLLTMIITYAREEPMPSIPDLSIEAPVGSALDIQTTDEEFTEAVHEARSIHEKMKTLILDNSRLVEQHPDGSLVAWGPESPFHNDPLRWIERNKGNGSEIDDTETASFGVSPTLQSVLNICASRPHSFSDIY